MSELTASPWGEPTSDDEEAARQFAKTFNHDPYEKIPPALLNSSDIYNYVCATGMVCPFETRRLKSASYAITIGEKVIFWDGSGNIQEKKLANGENFYLPDNSIAFIKTEEKFRLPNYMAIRFNLKINNVHRGILLGTGPLVDPGFEGHLLIPLHNLTTNSYALQRGETFVWVEFTKISPHESWSKFAYEQYKDYDLHQRYMPFPASKKNLTEWDYLNEAYKGPIRSSIPDALEDARKSATQAKGEVKTIRNFGIIGIIAVALGIFYWLEPKLFNMEAQLTSLTAQSRAAEIDRRLDKIEEQVHQLMLRDSSHP